MYESLTKRYRDQDSRSVFAHFPWREDMGEIWETPFQRLAEKARPEPWSTPYRRSGREFSILSAYLNHTFLRLQEQNKILYNAEDNRACLNTGLQSNEGLDIYATFYRNHGALEYDQPDWTLFGFFDAYSDRILEFNPLPSVATYTDNPHDLIYDWRLPLDIDYRYILCEYEGRLPELLTGNPILAHNALEGAVNHSLERLPRDYHLAIPAWFNNQLQFLLPISLLNHDNADIALLVEYAAEQQKYIARSILNLEAAYIHARILAPLYPRWLLKIAL